MAISELLQSLQDTVAPEANHLLTEPPGPSKQPGDFGWFCREHAFITSILCHTLGHPVQIVRGDVGAHYPSHFSLSCSGEHWWCAGALAEVLDLSLKLNYLGSPFTTSHAIIGVGSNGPFTIIIPSNIRRMNQSAALTDLRRRFPNAIRNIRTINESST